MRVPRTTKAPNGELSAARERSRTQKRTPELEIALGARIRAARVAAHMSQGALGEALGISFQQVQKYELGKDRVAASTLQGIAAALRIHPGSFFDEDMLSPRLPSNGTVASLRGAQRIGERVERLNDPLLVRQLMALIDVIVDARNGVAEGDRDAPDSGKR